MSEIQENDLEQAVVSVVNSAEFEEKAQKLMKQLISAEFSKALNGPKDTQPLIDRFSNFIVLDYLQSKFQITPTVFSSEIDIDSENELPEVLKSMLASIREKFISGSFSFLSNILSSVLEDGGFVVDLHRERQGKIGNTLFEGVNAALLEIDAQYKNSPRDVIHSIDSVRDNLTALIESDRANAIELAIKDTEARVRREEREMHNIKLQEYQSLLNSKFPFNGSSTSISAISLAERDSLVSQLHQLRSANHDLEDRVYEAESKAKLAFTKWKSAYMLMNGGGSDPLPNYDPFSSTDKAPTPEVATTSGSNSLNSLNNEVSRTTNLEATVASSSTLIQGLQAEIARLTMLSAPSKEVSSELSLERERNHMLEERISQLEASNTDLRVRLARYQERFKLQEKSVASQIESQAQAWRAEAAAVLLEERERARQREELLIQQARRMSDEARDAFYTQIAPLQTENAALRALLSNPSESKKAVSPSMNVPPQISKDLPYMEHPMRSNADTPARNTTIDSAHTSAILRSLSVPSSDSEFSAEVNEQRPSTGGINRPTNVPSGNKSAQSNGPSDVSGNIGISANTTQHSTAPVLAQEPTNSKISSIPAHDNSFMSSARIHQAPLAVSMVVPGGDRTSFSHLGGSSFVSPPTFPIPSTSSSDGASTGQGASSLRPPIHPSIQSTGNVNNNNLGNNNNSGTSFTSSGNTNSYSIHTIPTPVNTNMTVSPSGSLQSRPGPSVPGSRFVPNAHLLASLDSLVASIRPSDQNSNSPTPSSVIPKTTVDDEIKAVPKSSESILELNRILFGSPLHPGRSVRDDVLLASMEGQKSRQSTISQQQQDVLSNRLDSSFSQLNPNNAAVQTRIFGEPPVAPARAVTPSPPPTVSALSVPSKSHNTPPSADAADGEIASFHSTNYGNGSGDESLSNPLSGANPPSSSSSLGSVNAGRVNFGISKLKSPSSEPYQYQYQYQQYSPTNGQPTVKNTHIPGGRSSVTDPLNAYSSTRSSIDLSGIPSSEFNRSNSLINMGMNRFAGNNVVQETVSSYEDSTPSSPAHNSTLPSSPLRPAAPALHLGPAPLEGTSQFTVYSLNSVGAMSLQPLRTTVEDVDTRKDIGKNPDIALSPNSQNTYGIDDSDATFIDSESDMINTRRPSPIGSASSKEDLVGYSADDEVLESINSMVIDMNTSAAPITQSGITISGSMNPEDEYSDDTDSFDLY